jgi:hypothetical protein
MSNGNDAKVSDGDMFTGRARDRGRNWEGAVQKQDGRNGQTSNGTTIPLIYLAQEPSPGIGLPQCPASHQTPEIPSANGISILPAENRLTNGACSGADLSLFEIWMFPEPKVPGSAI